MSPSEKMRRSNLLIYRCRGGVSMDHLPVLYREALEALCIKKDGVYLDCT